MLLNLIRSTSHLVRHHIITSDVSEEAFLNKLHLAGAEISILPNFRRHPIRFILEMRTLVLKNKPNIVHSWMYFANIASIALWLNNSIVWSFHAERLSDRLLPFLFEILLIPASYIFPSAIIFPSRISLRNYTKVGFCKDISTFIYNPIDLQNLCSDTSAGIKFREKYSYPNGLIVGCAARWHAQKGHIFLFDSLSKAIDMGADITLVCAGRYLDVQHEEVMTAIRIRGLAGRVILVGQQDDMRGFYNSLDLLVVPSHTEAFGNVIIESYGCGIPVLSTNCGGPEEIIFSPECLVPVDDVKSMSAMLLKFYSGQWKPSTDKLGEYASNFSPVLVGEEYLNLYRQLM